MKIKRKSKQAFTLIELLVIMAVISILAGMLFPALNMIRQRAWDTTARELCLQACVAWNSLLLEQRQYPPMTLLKDTGYASDLDDGDIEVVMTTKATSLLNWWKPRHPDPIKDAKAYEDWLRAKGVEFNDSGFGIKTWPKNLNDLYLERTSDQRKWGLIAPWAKRYISEKDGNTIGDEEKAHVRSATVHVLLDTNRDGKITLPADHPLGKIELNKTAAAWVYGDEKQIRIIKSW